MIMLLCQLFHHAYLVSYMTTYSPLCHTPISLGLPVDYLQPVIYQCLEFICLANLLYLPCLPCLYLVLYAFVLCQAFYAYTHYAMLIKSAMSTQSLPTTIGMVTLCPSLFSFLYSHLHSYIVYFMLSTYCASLWSNMLPWLFNLLCLTSLQYIASQLFSLLPYLVLFLCIIILIVFYVVQYTLPYQSAQLTHHNMNTFNILHAYLASQPTKYSSKCPVAFYIHLVS